MKKRRTRFTLFPVIKQGLKKLMKSTLWKHRKEILDFIFLLTNKLSSK